MIGKHRIVAEPGNNPSVKDQVFRLSEGWHVIFNNQLQSPTFNRKSAGEAFLDGLQKGTRKPEVFQATSTIAGRMGKAAKKVRTRFVIRVTIPPRDVVVVTDVDSKTTDEVLELGRRQMRGEMAAVVDYAWKTWEAEILKQEET